MADFTPDDKDDPKPEKPTHKQPGRLDQLRAWVKAKPHRPYLLAGLAGALLIFAVVSTDMKYTLLGAVWKSDVAVKVIDSGTKLPLGNVTVAINGTSSVTDKTGVAELKNIHPGHETVKVSRVAYATFQQNRLIGFGRVTTEAIVLKATGVRVISVVTNKLSGEGVKGVEVKAGEIQAITDDTGRAELIFPPSANDSNAKITYTRDGFNDLSFETKVKLNGAPVAVAVVPVGKTYYLSNRSSKIDLYESNLDGSGEELALAGSGKEDTETGILPSILVHDRLAIVSSREGKRDINGNLVHALFMFNTSDKTLTKIEDDYGFSNYRAWVGDSLIYAKYPANADCSDIRSYTPSSQHTAVLVPYTVCPTIVAPYDDGFFYSVARGSSDKLGLFFGQLGGKSAKRVSETPSNSIVRRVKQTILSVYYAYTPNYTPVWQSVDLDNLTSTKVANGPSDNDSRAYDDSPAAKYSSFIEERDGKSELYLTDKDGGNEKKLTALGSVNQFVQWIGDDYIIFSSTRSDENALYIVAVSNGKVTKLNDFYRANNRTYSGGYSPTY